ncbi:MAG: N-acyl homoserine lactonase family protein [Lachnospiraceae bacterium]|jgi:N-acyl homoserine lactone hydrolase|nr:N-acyl homoserine lactonase family protein [Lachnospiraceae bacterium]
MKVNVLYLGKLYCKRDYLIQCGDQNAMIQSPISAILIRHPKLGNILYDTGNSPYYSREYPKSVLETYPVEEFISIEEALKLHGLTAEDIDMLILSHLHFDHAGGLRYFAGTKALHNVLVSESELKHAYHHVITGKKSAYIKPLFDVEGIRYQTWKDELELADDISLFAQNSHTPGCAGMLLKLLEQGNMIVTSDTIYTKDNFELELPPGGSINATTEEFYTNLARIKKMQAQWNAGLIYGHDFEQISRLSRCTLQ